MNECRGEKLLGFSRLGLFDCSLLMLVAPSLPSLTWWRETKKSKKKMAGGNIRFLERELVVERNGKGVARDFGRQVRVFIEE